MDTDSRWPPRMPLRRVSQLRTWEQALIRGGLGPVAGVDEAGRGACAGPLVVAACILPEKKHAELADLADSKKLSVANRDRLFPVIQRVALAWNVVEISSTHVDEIGVHRANIEGMRRAIAGLSLKPGYVLVDGFVVPGLGVPSLPVIGGDTVIACVAAASVLAKVYRDRIMTRCEGEYPGYDFALHKGYATVKHMDRLRMLGPCQEHRKSYRNVAQVISERIDIQRNSS